MSFYFSFFIKARFPKTKELHDFCGCCFQYQGMNSLPLACWTSDPPLTYIPSPLNDFVTQLTWNLPSCLSGSQQLTLQECATGQGQESLLNRFCVTPGGVFVVQKLVLRFWVPGCIFIFTQLHEHKQCIIMILLQ